MKTHLPACLRALVLAIASAPAVSAALTWNSGTWNTTDSSWLDAGVPAVFVNGDAVEFSAGAADTNVNITETVEPSSVVVSGSGYVFSGAGSIGGSTSLELLAGASLTVANSNSFTGGSSLETGASLRLTQYDGLGTADASQRALGSVAGNGQLVLALETPGTTAAILGNSLAGFNGTLTVEQGNLGLGRPSNHSGAGTNATLGAELVQVGANGSFTLSLGGGRAALQTGNSFASDVSTVSGAIIGNRDGHVNWSGQVELNLQSLESSTPVYDSAGHTEMAFHYSKYVVWDGEVRGDGVLEITSSAADSGNDHRLVLTNSGNSFSGTYRLAASYLTSLALTDAQAAASAAIELDSASSRLILMNTDASIVSLNGSSGTVQAEGDVPCVLSIGSGTFSGTVADAAVASPPLSLGITKVGDGTLTLNGSSCSYTGGTTVQAGNLLFTGDTTLSDIVMEAGLLQTQGQLQLRSGAALSFALAGTPAGAMVQSGGALVLGDAAHAVSVSGYESLAVGSYDLMTWTTATAVESTDFSPQGLNATAEKTYALRVNGQALQLVITSTADTPWLWTAGSASWSDDSVSEWSNTGGGVPAGQALTFGPGSAGTVTLDHVTPGSVSIIGGEYTFTGASATSSGIESSGALTISGDSTLVQMNLDNTALTGPVMLQGGTLVMGAENALGTGGLYFNGGTLRYGSGLNPDLSARVQAGSTSQVRVDTNGNTVSWNSVTGVPQSLQLGIVKSGEGSLQLSWAGSGETYTGALEVQQGTLSLSKGSGNSSLAGGISGTGELALTSASGQLTVWGDNSAFQGTISLVGDGQPGTGSVCFNNGAALGGSQTQVRVAGQRFWFASSTDTSAKLEIVEGTTTYFDGSSGSSYTFSGQVTGSGTFALKPSSNITMSGDIGTFDGVFIHPGSSNVTWLLGGEGISGSGVLQAGLQASSGNMVYAISYSSPTLMSGAVTGAANLRQQGSGALTLTGQNSTSGTLTIDAGCEVLLGDATTSSTWAGSVQAGTGQFTLVNGTLAQPLATVEGVLVADVPEGCLVDAGGTAGSLLQSVSVGAGGQLTGIGGDVHVGGTGNTATLSLTFSEANIGNAPAPAAGEQSLLVQENGELIISSGTLVTLDNEAIKTLIQGKRQAVYLHVSNGDIVLGSGVTAASLFANSTTTPEALGLTVLGVEQGNIVLEGAVTDVYMVTQDGDYPTVTSPTRLQDYKATFVDSGYTLSLQIAGDNTRPVWVNNLLGAGNLELVNTDETAGVLRVLLNNAVLGNVDSSLTPEQESEINTANTLLEGNMTAGSAVQLVKTGSGTLTVGGVLTTPWLELDEGQLVLTGQGSEVQSLHGSAALELAAGSTLEIEGNSLGFTGSINGTGALELNGSLPGSGSVGALSGNGLLQANSGTFTVGNATSSTFSGTLGSNSTATGLLVVESGSGTFTMERVLSSSAWSVQNEGSLVLQLDSTGGNAPLTLGTLDLQDGSSTSLVWNSDGNNDLLQLERLVVEESASLTLQSTGQAPVSLRPDGTLVLGQVQQADLGTDARAAVTLGSGAPFRGIDSAWLSVENGHLLLNTIIRQDNRYAEAVSSPNAGAGAGMLWNLPARVLTESPALSALTNTLDTLLDAGDTQAAEELMAAAAGAGAAVLAPAVAGDMERQLKAIRNRTIVMGLPAGCEYAELPHHHFWVNAEGDRRKWQSSGTDSGFELNSWGGTLGLEWNPSTAWTAGLALTAMYGDVDGSGTDAASGNIDFYYLSVFGKYVDRRWRHTLVGAFGRADMDLKRHLVAEGVNERTKGSTHGMSLGLLYELGYDIPLLTVSPAIVEPVFNISYRHAEVDAYDEHGSDAALHVGRQDWDSLTFGLGLRVHTTALENLCNRSCLVQTRFLMKADAGSTRGHTTTSLLALPSRSGRVRTAEANRFGLEMGIGLSVPLGEESGDLFMDCSYECRFDESEVNGTLGYRLSF